MNIGSRRIGSGEPIFVIAEAGVNHNGSLSMALDMVKAAARAGADAVKFQTFSAEALAAPGAPKADYQHAGDAAADQFEMLKALELNAQAHRELVGACADAGLIFLSTPFDEASADMLHDLGAPAFKVSSGDLTNLDLLRHVASKGRPMIVSTGMGTLAETEAAVQAVRDAGCLDLALLHCVSNYPADPADANLRAMSTLGQAFGAPVGWSDHTLGFAVSWGAAAMGAQIIEKHFTLDPSLPGPDQKLSLSPDALTAFVEGIRTVESALGDGRKRPTPAEIEMARFARRSLVARIDIPAGAVIDASMLAVRRPGTGLAPSARVWVLGRKAARDIAAGAVLSRDLLD